MKLYDKRVTEESVPKIIEAMTNALVESSGAAKSDGTSWTRHDGRSCRSDFGRKER